MALELSTGLRDFLNQGGSIERAFVNGAMVIYSGSAPTTADAAVTGTLLVTVTASSGTRTNEVQATGTVELTAGTTGTVSSILIADNAGAAGVECLAVGGASAVDFDTDLPTTATAVVTQFNRLNPLELWAVSDGTATPLITITAPRGVGAVTWGVTSASTGDITTADVNFSGGTNPANGLQWGLSASGTIAKNGTWSGTIAATGVAGYWRLVGSIADAGGLSTTLIRLQGTCGTSGADYNMGSTSLTLNQTHTVDTFQITTPDD